MKYMTSYILVCGGDRSDLVVEINSNQSVATNSDAVEAIDSDLVVVMGS